MKDILLALQPDLSIQISSTQHLEITDTTKLISKAYLPGVEWGKSPNNAPSIHINHIESPDKHMEVNGESITIYDTWNGQIPLDLWHLGYSASRLKHLQNDRYSIHAACAGRDSHTLLVGHSGVGKTSILLEMIQKYGWKVFSGNKTVTSFNDDLQAIEVIAGISSITLSAGEESKYATLGETSQYNNRGSFNLDPKHYETRDQVDIQSIILVQLNDGVSNSRQLTPMSAMHTLYPYFLDTVNADTIMCDGNAVFDGSTSQETKQKLAGHLKMALTKIPTFKVVGSMDFVTAQIAEITK